MHAYPDKLAALVRRRWNAPYSGANLFKLPVYPSAAALPPAARLRELLSNCYQASLLREEGRAVRFRLILGDAESLTRTTPRPGLLEIMLFQWPLQLTPNELRRLAAAAAFEHALVAARIEDDGRFVIWGLVHSGDAWMRALEGSRRTFQPLPPAVVVSVTGPGNLSVAKGSLVVARLLGGQLVTPTPSVLEVATDDAESEAVNNLLLAAHLRDRRRRGRHWARVTPALVSLIRRQMALRVISAMRHLHHGGTLITLPRSIARNPRRWRPMLNIKYAFAADDARRSLFRLTTRLLEVLADDAGGRFGPEHKLTWADYLSSTSPAVHEADEATADAVRFAASLSAVDGAVVMAQPLELLGFGAEISGRLAPVHQVARALDSLASRTKLESDQDVGTRHRSAYRICHALPGVVAVVVSQDGSLRIIKRVGRRVVYSQHLGTGVLDA